VNELAYHVVDVFTDRAYAGNPLAVVLDADDLTDTQMQSIAREFNLSETTFVLAPTTAEATYRARIFTPSVELPFAGHPSVGTAWLLQSLGRFRVGPVVQECGAGLLPIVVSADGALLTGGPVSLSEPVDTSDLAAAVGATEADLVGTPARWCGCGIDWGYVHVHDAFLDRAVPDVPALERLGHTGVCVFSLDGTSVHARVFAGGAGVPEDPATGSAALGLGVFLVASGLLPGDGDSSFSISQGVEMGRPSTLAVTVRAQSGTVVDAKVSGGVAPVATGTITVPTITVPTITGLRA
jgi:trans-2,3-dihydro-3-hydroxyanthranilate isomerase